MSDKILLPHTVTIENRNQMSVSGVRQVVAYDEMHIILRTDYGILVIQGREMIAGEISSTSNTMKLTGKIETLQYKAAKDKSEGFLSRILK